MSVVAERLKRGDRDAAASALSAALQLAALAGSALALLYLTRGDALLSLTGADPAVLVPAGRYLRIRALALPAVITVQVAQAGEAGPAGGTVGGRASEKALPVLALPHSRFRAPAGCSNTS